MTRSVRFCPGSNLQPLHHCCCGCVDIEIGYRVMCLAFALYGFIGFFMACANLGASEDVWKDRGAFNSKGLAVSRLLLHTGFTALQFVGLRAHWNRDATKADYYFWGFAAFTAVSMCVDISRISAIESDALVYEDEQCRKCVPLFTDPLATDCQDERVKACMNFNSGSYQAYAHFVLVCTLLINFSFNLYFSLVARSYWFHLHDDKLILLGQSVVDESLEALTPMEQQALGGDTNVYVRMEERSGV